MPGQIGISASTAVNRCRRNTIDNNARIQPKQDMEHREQDKNAPIIEEQTRAVMGAGRKIRFPDRFQAGLK